MRFRYRTTVVAGAAALLCGALVSPSTATPASATTAPAVQADIQPQDIGVTDTQSKTITLANNTTKTISCDSGYVCFYNGAGTRCAWQSAATNWTACSWRDQKVYYIWNRGQSSAYTGVAYYKKTLYGERVGCTKQGNHGYLSHSYAVNSHRWITTSCGS